MTAVRSARAARPALLSEFLGSMNLAITLLVVVAVASVIGTVLKQNEPYTNYVIKFGPFWFEVFRKLGLYDVYGAPWFLAILGFLVLSTGVCLWRHVPGMLAEINHFRLTVQAKSLRAFHSHAEWTLAADPATVAAQAAGALRAQGYRVRSSTHEDGHTVLAALRGSLNRFGYLFTHLAIVVICVGGLLDGNLPLKWKEWRGEVKLETRDVVARDVKVQVEFDPQVVRTYRLIGYENRDVADKDFRNDKVDGGEVGAGHSVTALYDVVLASDAQRKSPATVRIRYQSPIVSGGAVQVAVDSVGAKTVDTTNKPAAGAKSVDGASELAFVMPASALLNSFVDTPRNFQRAVAVAGFAETLRRSPYAGGMDITLGIAKRANDDSEEDRELLVLMEKAIALGAARASLTIAR